MNPIEARLKLERLNQAALDELAAKLVSGVELSADESEFRTLVDQDSLAEAVARLRGTAEFRRVGLVGESWKKVVADSAAEQMRLISKLTELEKEVAEAEKTLSEKKSQRDQAAQMKLQSELRQQAADSLRRNVLKFLRPVDASEMRSEFLELRGKCYPRIQELRGALERADLTRRASGDKLAEIAHVDMAPTDPRRPALGCDNARPGDEISSKRCRIAGVDHFLAFNERDLLTWQASVAAKVPAMQSELKALEQKLAEAEAEITEKYLSILKGQN